MKSIRPLDTSAEAYKKQLEIFQAMTPEERLQRGSELTQFSRGLMADGVKFRHPEYSSNEIHLAVIRIELGDKLFLKVYPHAENILP